MVNPENIVLERPISRIGEFEVRRGGRGKGRGEGEEEREKEGEEEKEKEGWLTPKVLISL